MTTSSLPAPAVLAGSVLILGARGRLGQALTLAFARAGWRVLAQARPGKAVPADLPDGVHWIELPLTDGAALAHAAAGTQVVVHALNPASYTNKAWQREAPGFMDAALQLATTLNATLMLPGNVYNHGRTMPPRLDEATPFAPDTAKGRLRVALEARMRAAAESGGPRGVVIRAGDFFGSGTGSWLDLIMAAKLHKGQVSLQGPAHLPHAWAYLPDLAQAFVRVAERRGELPAFATLHFRGHTLRGRDWVDALQPVAQAQGWVEAGRPLRQKAVPWPLLRLLGLVVPTLASVCEMRYLWFTPHELDNRRLQALVGDEPHTPTRQAVAQALRDLGYCHEGRGAAADTRAGAETPAPAGTAPGRSQAGPHRGPPPTARRAKAVP